MDETRLKKILDASPDTYLIVDGKGFLVDFKPSGNFISALPSAKSHDLLVEEVLPVELAETVLLRVREVLEAGKEGLTECSILVDGVSYYYEARFTFFDENQVLVILSPVGIA